MTANIRSPRVVLSSMVLIVFAYCVACTTDANRTQNSAKYPPNAPSGPLSKIPPSNQTSTAPAGTFVTPKPTNHNAQPIGPSSASRTTGCKALEIGKYGEVRMVQLSIVQGALTSLSFEFQSATFSINAHALNLPIRIHEGQWIELLLKVTETDSLSVNNSKKTIRIKISPESFQIDSHSAGDLTTYLPAVDGPCQDAVQRSANPSSLTPNAPTAPSPSTGEPAPSAPEPPTSTQCPGSVQEAETTRCGTDGAQCSFYEKCCRFDAICMSGTWLVSAPRCPPGCSLQGPLQCDHCPDDE